MDESNLSDEQIQQLMQLGIIPQQQDILGKQLQLAQGLRYSQGPQGRDSGRVYTAPNPLEVAMHNIQQYQAGKQMQDIQQKQQDMLRKQALGRAALAKLLYGQHDGSNADIGSQAGGTTTYYGDQSSEY